jgi:uncharacterized phage-associated protein
VAYPATRIANAIVALGARQNLTFTPLQVIKLVFIAHGWTLALLDKPLANERAAAWLYGPVFPQLYHELKEYRARPVPIPNDNFSGFLANEREILEEVVHIYGKFSGGQLSHMTHLPGTPWYKIWNEFGQNHEIPDSLIQDYYKALAREPEHSST